MILNPLLESNVRQKVALFADLTLEQIQSDWIVPKIPARDLEVKTPEEMPPRKGFSLIEGRARLLHDLGNIELQAVELCLRTLIEFPEAPVELRRELFEILQSERSHLELCLNGLESLGFHWGQWPVHIGLWAAVDPADDLMDRLLIVHRYLEGSGLDAGSNLMKRLKGVKPDIVHKIVDQITTEELGHVKFGSSWYRKLCVLNNLEPEADFPIRFAKIEHQIPKRIDKLNRELRKLAGFSDQELDFLEAKIKSWSLF